MEFLDNSMVPYRGRGSVFGEKRRAGVFAVLVATLVTAILGSGAMLMSAFSGTTVTQDPFVTLYERADGTTIPVGDLTCAVLARDLLALNKPISGSGRSWSPDVLGKPYPVKDDVAAAAALSEGGVRQHLLTCDSTARFVGEETEKVRFGLHVYGGVARAADASLTTIRR